MVTAQHTSRLSALGRDAPGRRWWSGGRPADLLAATRLVLSVLLVALAIAHVSGGLSFAPALTLQRWVESGLVRLFEPGEQDPRVVVLDMPAEQLLSGTDRQRADQLGSLAATLHDAGALGVAFLLPLPAGDAGRLVGASLQDRAVAFVQRPGQPCGRQCGAPLAGVGRGDRLQAVPLVRYPRDEQPPSIALRLVEQVLHAEAAPVPDRLSELVLVSAGRSVRHLPLDADGAVRVPVRMTAGHVLHVDVPARRYIEGRAVVVAPAVLPIGADPTRASGDGADLLALTVSAILAGHLKTLPPGIVGILVVSLMLVGLTWVLMLPRLGRIGAGVLALLIALGALLVTAIAWRLADRIVPVGDLLALLLALMMIESLHATIADARARRAFASVFGSYVPPVLVEQMARDPASYRNLIAPRNETLTVLFADLRGFTAVAERMTPEGVRLFLDEYFTAMSEVVHDFGGTVDKYIGDEVMAFWGAPLADPGHARHAVLAAMRMREAIAHLRTRIEPGEGEELDLRVGINTGLMSVGDMGSTLRRSYTVLGDSVNLAKRIESLTRYYGVGIMIGEQTRIRVPDLVCREIDWVQVKGRGGVVTIHEPIGFASEIESTRLDELGLWARALQAYRLRRWQEADAILLRLQQTGTETGLYRLYRSRIVRFRNEPPPPQWNGVTVFDRK